MTEKLFDVGERLRRLQAQVEAACIAANRDPKEVSLMGVTKTQPSELVNAAIDAGLSLLGENRAQELCERYDAYQKDGTDIHFIGHLQTNKVRSILDKVSLIHSVDRLSLAKEISRLCLAENRVMPILIEVNIGREQSKSGVLPEALEETIAQIAAFPALSIRGLMAIPPNCENSVEKEEYFARMYRHFVDIRGKNIDNVSMEILSMGMSEDFALAIRQGSTLVRLGRVLFGERTEKGAN